MIPELGHVALILALQLALIQGLLPLWGAARGRPGLMAVAAPAAWGQLLFVFLGFAALVRSFVVSDFSVVNVVQHSSVELPAIYKMTAAWGAHEGSMLLWTLLLAAWGGAVAAGCRDVPQEVRARVLAVIGLVGCGFLAFILFTSNPFLRLDPPPKEGTDLNPLLQDPGMVLHPPILYMGYVGLSVAFAFAVAALLSNAPDRRWAGWARPWTLAAWLFLTLGIMMGSWWAYYELGWGGWWFWDPTENASLMPWLAATALLHSLLATDKRAAFGAWTAFLAILAFALSLLGTFLVRSGVLSSVHAFAQDPARGLFILGLLAAAIGSGLVLFALRGRRVRADVEFAALSRESLFLALTVLLLVALGTVLLGTLYPMALDALGLGKVSVGPPYFNLVFFPLAVPVLALMGLGPFIPWQRIAAGALPRPLALAAGFSFGGGLLAALAAGDVPWQAPLGFGLALWILVATAFALWRRRGQAMPLSFAGMAVAHLGMAVTVAGMTAVSCYQSERDVVMGKGDTAMLAGYTFTFLGVADDVGPNYEAAIGRVAVSRDGKPVATLVPEKRRYAVGQPMTESAIDYGFTRDLYVALGEPAQDDPRPDAWVVRLFHKPMVTWIWGGALLMALGGLLAAVASARAKAAP